MPDREVMEFDVVIVGGGPAGLSAAIRLRQMAQAHGLEISVCVLEKGAEIGAHTLSGAVIEPRALNELIPDWQKRGAPLETAARKDNFWFLTQKKKISMPVPPQMHNDGNYIVSLGRVVRWLGQEAEKSGAEIIPGFAGTHLLRDDDGTVTGVSTGDMGVGKDGKPGPNHMSGVDIKARYTLLAEGCRGSLTESLINELGLRQSSCPQSYAIGIKELWEVSENKDSAGEIIHTIGWPLDRKTYGGSFIYRLTDSKIAIGFVVGLDYENPHLSPFMEFQRFKHHPAIESLLSGGRRIAYGARALNEGGWQSIPALSFDGGLIAGCAAGFLNVPKIKGTHTSMKSGMLAAETIFEALAEEKPPKRPENFEEKIRNSWISEELRRVRNIRPAFRWGLWAGLGYAALDTYLLRGRAPWTFKHTADHTRLKNADQCRPIDYPKPDGKISFDRLSSLAESGVYHEENQPCHLTLKDPEKAIDVNLKNYASPETRYCPAGVYEIVENDGNAPRLQINAQNCVHCKTCDIKDPTQNIRWVPPEGGGGPSYGEM